MSGPGRVLPRIPARITGPGVVVFKAPQILVSQVQLSSSSRSLAPQQQGAVPITAERNGSQTQFRGENDPSQEIHPVLGSACLACLAQKSASKFDLLGELAAPAPSESPSAFAAGAVLCVGTGRNVRANCLWHERTLHTGSAEDHPVDPGEPR